MMEEDGIITTTTSWDSAAALKQQKTEARLKSATANANFVAHEVRNSVYNLDSNNSELEVCLAQLEHHADFHPNLQALINQIKVLTSANVLSSKAMLAVVNNQLDYAKITAKKMVLNTHALKLNEFMGDLIKTFQARCLQKKINLDLVMPPHDLWINSDNNALTSIFSNFISNAIKFTEHGAITITITAETSHKKVLDTTITIRDTGIGIATENLPQLFQEFNQIHSNHHTHGGTGLGLTTAKKFVGLLNGQITTHSEVGVGTTFSLHFNFPVPTLQQRRALTPQVQLSAISPSMQKTLRVLIVDDSITSSKCTRQLVKYIGHHADTATNGLEAIKAYQASIDQKNTFDLILMDINLGEMSGLETTQAIRTIEINRSIMPCLIIGVSGDSVALGQNAALDAGMDAYLVKPITVTQLQACLNNLQDSSVNQHKAPTNSITNASPSYDSKYAKRLTETLNFSTVNNGVIADTAHL